MHEIARDVGSMATELGWNVVLFHGTNDQVISVQDAHDYLGLIGSNVAELHRLDGVDHFYRGEHDVATVVGHLKGSLCGLD